jgi:hypothetical protein
VQPVGCIVVNPPPVLSSLRSGSPSKSDSLQASPLLDPPPTEGTNAPFAVGSRPCRRGWANYAIASGNWVIAEYVHRPRAEPMSRRWKWRPGLTAGDENGADVGEAGGRRAVAAGPYTTGTVVQTTGETPVPL